MEDKTAKHAKYTNAHRISHTERAEDTEGKINLTADEDKKKERDS